MQCALCACFSLHSCLESCVRASEAKHEEKGKTANAYDFVTEIAAICYTLYSEIRIAALQRTTDSSLT